MKKPPIRMILVGGFLGAGKTTLLARAVEYFAARNKRAGLITNDQAAGLVDTELLRQSGFSVGEVAGGCFCCGFDRLLYACDQLIEQYDPDVLIGEPVGSCTDLSAAVLQPLKKHCADRFELSPFSVLIDPQRLTELIEGQCDKLEPDVQYIFAKQLEEADILVLNKIDQVSQDQRRRLHAALEQRLPGRPVLEISAMTGEGVQQWLELSMQSTLAGRHLAQVNYDVYAAGEAALGWLNALIKLADTRPENTSSPVDWTAYALSLMQAVQAHCRKTNVEIAHVKLFISDGSSNASVKGNLTATDGCPVVSGRVISDKVTLVLNARVDTLPEALRQIIEQALNDAEQAIPVRHKIAAIRNFAPPRPAPTYRFDSISD